MVYDQLRTLARQRMSSEKRGHTLQATGLVHEAYLRLASADVRFVNQKHFFWMAAEAMRRILVEHARRKGRIKRGGAVHRLPLNVLDLAMLDDSEDILALDEAIQRLEEGMPEVAAVVRLRFFAGLSVAETGHALEISARTVNRHWTYARAWLFRLLEEDSDKA